MKLNPKYLPGKVIGLTLGALIGSYLGGLIGLVVGAVIDKLHQDGGQLWAVNRREPKNIQDTDPNDFVVSAILLAGVVVKSDGEVEDLELSYVRTFLLEQFGTANMENYWAILNESIQKDFDLKKTTLQVRQSTSYETRLQLIYFLFGIANADYNIDDNEIATIKVISLHLGIHNAEYASIKAMFYSDMHAYYTILKVPPSATDYEVKSAYRTIMQKYHPDKLQHLGQGVVNAANNKFLKVQEAFEAIRKERGFK